MLHFRHTLTRRKWNRAPRVPAPRSAPNSPSISFTMLAPYRATAAIGNNNQTISNRSALLNDSIPRRSSYIEGAVEHFSNNLSLNINSQSLDARFNSQSVLARSPSLNSFCSKFVVHKFSKSQLRKLTMAYLIGRLIVVGELSKEKVFRIE